jgi:hypothetical protein
VSSGAIDVEPLIAAIYPMEQAQAAFHAIRERTLPGIVGLLSYSREPTRRRTIDIKPRVKSDGKGGFGARRVR